MKHALYCYNLFISCYSPVLKNTDIYYILCYEKKRFRGDDFYNSSLILYYCLELELVNKMMWNICLWVDWLWFFFLQTYFLLAKLIFSSPCFLFLGGFLIFLACNLLFYCYLLNFNFIEKNCFNHYSLFLNEA